jgi:hypothetical protein
VWYPEHWSCAECRRLARQFQAAWHADQRDIRAHLYETAHAAGREPQAFVHGWVMSLAQMSDDEFDSLQAARYPRAADVRRRWNEHEIQSGHAGPAAGWRGAFIFDLVRAGYHGFIDRESRGDR